MTALRTSLSRDDRLALDRERYANNPKAQQARRERHARHRERHSENHRRWYEANRDARIEADRRWRHENPEKARDLARSQNRRKRLGRNAEAIVTATAVRLVAAGRSVTVTPTATLERAVAVTRAVTTTVTTALGRLVVITRSVVATSIASLLGARARAGVRHRLAPGVRTPDRVAESGIRPATTIAPSTRQRHTLEAE